MSEPDNQFLKIDDTVNLMRDRYAHLLPENYIGDEDKFYYELAQEKFPNWNLPDYKTSLVDTSTYLDIDYSTVDTSFQTVDNLNYQYENMVNLHVNEIQEEFISNIPEEIGRAYKRETFRILNETGNNLNSIGAINIEDKDAFESALESTIISKQDKELVALAQDELAYNEWQENLKKSLSYKSLLKNKDNLPYFKRMLKFTADLQKEIGLSNVMTDIVKETLEKPIAHMLLNPNSKMHIKDQRWRNILTYSVNRTSTAMTKNGLMGHELHPSWYEEMDNFDPNSMTNIEYLVSQVITQVDPLGVAMLFGGAKAGKVTGDWVAKPVSAWMAKRWGSAATNQFIHKSIPKTTFGTNFSKWYKKLNLRTHHHSFDKISSKLKLGLGGVGLQLFKGAHTFGTISATQGLYQSRLAQTYNFGKYETNNGTVNFTDTLNDAWESYKDGASIGLITTGVGSTLGIGNLIAKSKKFSILEKHLRGGQPLAFSQTPSGYKAFSALEKATSTPLQLGAQGLALTSAPLIWDKEMRKMYYDSNGNFLPGRFSTDVLFSTGLIYAFWGLDQGTARWGAMGYVNNPLKYSTKVHTGVPKKQNRNMANHIKDVKKEVVVDVEFQTIKKTKADLTKQETKISNSIKNVTADLNNQGMEAPFEFFKHDVDKQTGTIQTLEGLTAINEGVSKAVGILEKAGIVNDEGEYVGVDTSQLTEEDNMFLLYEVPKILDAYQGYRITTFESEEGRNEYIERYEQKYNNGKKLSENQRKVVLNILENKIKDYDLIKHDFNKWVTEGQTKAEQVVSENPSELEQATPKMDVIHVENGIPVDNTIITIDADDAKRGIAEGRFITPSEAENKGITPVEQTSDNHGLKGTEAETQEDMIQRAMNKVLVEYEKRTQPLSENIPKNKEQYDKVIEDANLTLHQDTDKTSGSLIGQPYYKPAEELGISESKVDAIKTPYDIAILKEAKKADVLKGFDAKVSHVNKILKHSGKGSITELTEGDLKSYWKDKKLEKAEKEQIPGIDTTETSHVKLLFEWLNDKGYIANSPMTTSLQKSLTAEFNALRKDPELPSISEWFGNMPRLYNNKRFKDNRVLSIGLSIVDNYPIRAEELNPITIRHIKFHDKSGEYYIDLTLGREYLGAAKARGVKRPVFIPKEIAEELLKFGKGNLNKLIFSSKGKTFTSKLTDTLKEVFPPMLVEIPQKGRPPITIKKDITSKAFKRQAKTFGEQLDLYGDEVGLNLIPLTPTEQRIFNVMAGHATPEEAKIVDLYKKAENWGTLFKHQESILGKIANAREQYENALKKQGLSIPERVKTGILEYLKKPKMGLGIEDVGGSIKNIFDKIKRFRSQNVEVDKDLHKEAKNLVQNVWENYLTSKEIGIGEKREHMTAIAQNAVIENPHSFGSKSGNLSITDSVDDLISFFDMVKSNQNLSKTSIKRYTKSVSLVTDAIKVLEYNDVSVNKQKQLAQFLFERLKNVPLKEINLLTLTPNEAQIYNEHVLINEAYKDLPETTYMEEALNFENLQTISEHMNKKGQAALILSGMRGEVGTVIDIIANSPKTPKNMKKALIQLKGRFYNHHAIEHAQGGGAYQGMLVDMYKTIYEHAVEQGTYMVLAQPTTWVRPGKRKYKYGMKVFEKKYANNLIVVATPSNYQWLVDRVASHPKDKVARKMLDNAKEFYELAWTPDGKIRKDTLEGKILKVYFNYTNQIRKMVEGSLRSIMNEPSLERYLKKHPIDWLQFYTPKIYTNEFKSAYKLKELSHEKRIKKATVAETEKLIQEFLKENPNKKRANITPKQYSDLELRAKANVLLDFIQQMNFGRKGQNPKHLLKRGHDYGLTIEHNGKYIKVIETDFDAIIDMATSQNKLMANIQMFPELVNLSGITFKDSANFIKLLSELDKAGSIGNYLRVMIEKTTGLGTIQSGLDSKLAKFYSTGNVYFSRLFLMLPTSPIKNYLLAQGMNTAKYEVPLLLNAAKTAFSFARRMEAMKTGYMQVSYSSMMKDHENLISRTIEPFFNAGRFPTSEQIGRLTAVLGAQLELPILCDALVSKNIEDVNAAINTFKNIYEVSDEPIVVSERSGLVIPDGEIGLLRKYGLGTTEADMTSKNALEARRLKKVDFNDFDFPLTPHEKMKLQMILNRVHSKIINMSHIRTSGGVSPMFQPYALARYPLIKAGALFAQLAYHGNVNILKLMGDNHKNKNNWRTFAFAGFRIGFTPLVMFALAQLLSPRDPGELDETKRARIFRRFVYADVLNLGSFTWGLLNKELPMSNPVLPFVSHDAIFGDDGIVDLFIDIAKAGMSKIGDPRGQGDLSSWYIRNDENFSGVNKTAEKIFPIYKKIKQHKLNWNNPYRVNDTRIDGMERKFKNEIDPWSDIQIIKNTTSDVYYNEMEEAFSTLSQNKDLEIGHEKLSKETMQKLVDSLDFEHFNRTVLSTMQQLYAHYLMSNPGMTDRKARKSVSQAIESKIRSLHPIFHGTGSSEEDVLFSKTLGFELWLKQLAKNQIKNNVKTKYVRSWKDKDEDYYVNIAQNQVYLYNTFVNRWGKQWKDWVKEQPDVKHDVLIDFFMLKGSFDKNGNYYNKSWKELGLTIDKLQDAKLYKHIDIPKKAP